MKSNYEEILECQRFLRVCCVAVLAVFWIPFVLLALDVTALKFVSNALFGLMIGGPVVMMLVTLWLAIRFLRAVPDPAVKEHWPVLILACLTCLPFFNLLGPFGCLQQVQQYLGRNPGMLPTSLPNRRCRCGGKMSMQGGQQWVKMIGKSPIGFIANFGCKTCGRLIEIPSLEVMAIDLVFSVVLVFLTLGGLVMVYDFIRQPAEGLFGVINVVLTVGVTLVVCGLVGVYVLRCSKRLSNRLRYRECRPPR